MMRFRFLQAACVAVALGLPNPTLAEVPVIYTDDGRSLFSVRVPDFWTMRTGGVRDLTAPGTEETRATNRVLGLQPISEEGVWVGFVSPAGIGTIGAGFEYLQDIGPFLVEDPQIGARKRHRIGGLPAESVSGQGRRDGRQVSFTALVADLPGNRVAVSVVVMEAGTDPALADEINRMLGTLRAVR